jgi:hypothetical protein
MEVSKKIRKTEIGNIADKVKSGSMNMDTAKITAKDKRA